MKSSIKVKNSLLVVDKTLITHSCRGPQYTRDMIPMKTTLILLETFQIVFLKIEDKIKTMFII